jgi:tetratricopeptide (TPR) repeat protein
MTTKSGRNDPCPCGSGKKYKRCCLVKDQQAESAALAAAAAAQAAEQAELEEQMASEDEFTDASNAVIDLIDAGKLDQAEQAARELLTRYPDVHDGYDRLGMVYEARGDRKQAAHCYRNALNIIHAHPQQYHPEFATTLEKLIVKLDPDAAA